MEKNTETCPLVGFSVIPGNGAEDGCGFELMLLSGLLGCVRQTFQTSPLKALEELSSLAFIATPALRGINCEFLTFKPLNKTVKQMGCWKN